MTLAVPFAGPPSPEAATRCSLVGTNFATAMMRCEDEDEDEDDENSGTLPAEDDDDDDDNQLQGA